MAAWQRPWQRWVTSDRAFGPPARPDVRYTSNSDQTAKCREGPISDIRAFENQRQGQPGRLGATCLGKIGDRIGARQVGEELVDVRIYLSVDDLFAALHDHHRRGRKADLGRFAVVDLRSSKFFELDWMRPRDTLGQHPFEFDAILAMPFPAGYAPLRTRPGRFSEKNRGASNRAEARRQ